jgi:hypothetical protein
MDDWYNYSEIHFTIDQTRWAADHYKELSEGIWPPNPGGSAYIGGNKKGISCEGNFVKPTIIAAELSRRIKRCGMDGFLVEEVINGKDEERIARERHLDINYIQRRINKVLWYCASGSKPGWLPTRWRHGMTYEEWKNNGCRFRKK